MATLDHIILKVNDLAASVAFYTEVLGFVLAGTDGPFTVIRVVAPGGRSVATGSSSLGGGRLKNHAGNSYGS